MLKNFMTQASVLAMVFSFGLIVGGCASKTDDVTTTDNATTDKADTASTTGDHQCSKECKHDKGQCPKDCPNAKNGQCPKDCKGHADATKAEGCEKHAHHGHTHGKDCGHKTTKHEGHVDYMHEGHQHFIHGDHVDEHKALKASKTKTPTDS